METLNEDILTTLLGYLDDHYERYSFMSINKMNYEYTTNWRKRNLSVYGLQVPPYFLETKLSGNVYIPSNLFSENMDRFVYAVTAALRENMFTIIYIYKKNMNKWISVFEKFTNVYSKDINNTKIICHGIHKYDLEDVINKKQILVTYPAVMKQFNRKEPVFLIQDSDVSSLFVNNSSRTIYLSNFDCHNKLIKFEENVKPIIINKYHTNIKPTWAGIVNTFIDEFIYNQEECTIVIVSKYTNFQNHYHHYGINQPDGLKYNASFNYEHRGILACVVVIYNHTMLLSTNFTNIIVYEGNNIDQLLNKRSSVQKKYKVLYYDGSYNATFKRKMNNMLTYIDNKDMQYILFALRLWNINPSSISGNDVKLLLNISGGVNQYNNWLLGSDNKLTIEQAKLYLDII